MSQIASIIHCSARVAKASHMLDLRVHGNEYIQSAARAGHNSLDLEIPPPPPPPPGGRGVHKCDSDRLGFKEVVFFQLQILVRDKKETVEHY